jgi:hypothetical protein
VAGNRWHLILGAVAGAALVALLASLFGELIRDLAHPGVVVACALFGGVLGAYAAGAIALDRARMAETPAMRTGTAPR